MVPLCVVVDAVVAYTAGVAKNTEAKMVVARRADTACVFVAGSSCNA